MGFCLLLALVVYINDDERVYGVMGANLIDLKNVSQYYIASKMSGSNLVSGKERYFEVTCIGFKLLFSILVPRKTLAPRRSTFLKMEKD
jgi:hypothetical protein